MVESIAISIPPEFAPGVQCSSGARLQLPVTVRASGEGPCTIAVHSDGDAIQPSSRQVTLGPSGGQLQVVFELVPRPEAIGRHWITVDATCGALRQAATFFLDLTR
jgi:hypothetical protein